MALFQVRSRFASVLRHHYRPSSASGLFSRTTPELKIPTSRVTSVLGQHYRSSASGFLSTMMKTPTIEDASNHLNRTVEERNEKHRKVQQLAKDDKLLILSCESTAEGGVCDVYVVGFNSFNSLESPKAAQAIMSYLKPQVLYLPFGYKPLLSIHPFWPTAERVAYREAIKYGCNVVIGDRPEEITEEGWEMMPRCIQLDDNKIFHGISTSQQDKLARLMAQRLLEVARKNSSVVAIVPCPRNVSRSFDNLGRINEYWKQLIEV